MGITRRAFLKLTGCTGASAMAGGLGVKNAQKLIPYVIPPNEYYQPGEWTIYATTCRECPAGCGLHARCVNGRATKAEGNPRSPVGHGALCARGQSSMQGLYDPDRIQGPMRRGRDGQLQATSWQSVMAGIADRLNNGGARAALMSDLQTSSLLAAMQEFAQAFNAPVLLYEPLNYQPLRAAHETLFGRAVIPRYRLDQCEFILSFAADFLETWISPVEFAHDFSLRHTYKNKKLGRFIYVGPRLSMTAANADEFLAVPVGKERWVALAILQQMIRQGLVRNDAARIASLAKALGGDEAASQCGLDETKLLAIARAFAQADGSVALAGPTGSTGQESQDTALAAALLNHAAGRIGSCVDFSRPHALSKTATHEQTRQFLAALTEDHVLFIHNTNPAYFMPDSAALLRKAGTIVYLGTLPDETAELADFVLPIDSPLESWGDYEPYASVHSLLQPTMRRLWDTCSAGDIFLSLGKSAGRDLPVSFEAFLKDRWTALAREMEPQTEVEAFWVSSLRAGGRVGDVPSPGLVGRPQLQGAIVVQASPPADPDNAKRVQARRPHHKTATTLPCLLPVTEALRLALTTSEVKPFAPARAEEGDKLDLWLYPSIMLFDGRTANRSWMQEAPDPMSTIVWGSWLDMHSQTASRLGLSDSDLVELTSPAGSLEIAVRITDQVVPGAVALATGQGHTAKGLQNASQGPHGVNAWRLVSPRTGSDGLFAKVSLRRLGGRDHWVNLSASQLQFHREILQWVSSSKLATMKSGEGDHLRLPLPEGYLGEGELYPPHYYSKHRWAMVVDLERCIGCGACAVACYAENNVATMGRAQDAKGREMAWLKVVPYHDQDDPSRIGFLPLMCQQCDSAPCEPVCPVFAAVHNEEGLNSQVYNRCIGTRYCSNNCPYKVRRFNWLDTPWRRPLEWQLNPEVTARQRGVMEKCTFCIQRIRHAELRARREGRPVRDGEIVPACAQTCPTTAIIFGDLLDNSSQVTQLTRSDPRRYHVLEELNAKPAVTYLRRIRRDDVMDSREERQNV